jgi:hypothetical protein
MDDFSGPVSTTLDPGAGLPTTAGGGAPSPEPAPSVRDAVAAAIKETAKPEEAPAAEEPVEGDSAPKKPKAEDEGGEKPEKAEKATEDKKAPDRGDGGKFVAKPVEGEPKPEAEAKPEDGKEPNTQVKQGLSQAPKNFLPDAKEKWANTPRSVQRDVENMIREAETVAAKHQETTQRYERIRDFDELARSNGRDLRESLAQVHQFENMMRQNPVAALNMALMQVGPRKGDGQPFSLFEVAQHIVQSGPEGYQRMAQVHQQQDRQPAANQEIEQLKQQLASMQEQQVTSSIIEPFKAAHPRYEELREDIAFFLSSGRIPQSLSHSERLAAAYDMAERNNPSSHVPQARQSGPGDDETSRADNDSSGMKSIRSAPGSVTPDEEPERGGSIREELMRAVQRQRRA